MQLECKQNKLKFYLGDIRDCERIKQQRPQEPFSEDAVDFLAALSERLREGSDLRQMPDAAAFAFWCRRAHLEQMRSEYAADEKLRLGRGVSLHFAPSNMEVLFAFSMSAGLLAGNSAIVRLPRRESVQERVIVAALESLLETDFPEFLGRILLCRYGHDREITEWLSSLCDVRVIWGSDTSVREIRSVPLPARAVELPFASRGSAAVLDAESVLRAERIDLLAADFYNDTYRNDQNACSSPQMIFWLGGRDSARAAGERFWSEMEKLLDRKQYEISACSAVQKLDGALRLAADFDGSRILHRKNRIIRVQVPEFDRRMWEYTVPGGFFIESGGEELDGLRRICTGHCQTICVYGVKPQKLAQRIPIWQVTGADRIVPVGRALDFTLIWDGFDLIESMSRRIFSETHREITEI